MSSKPDTAPLLAFLTRASGVVTPTIARAVIGQLGPLSTPAVDEADRAAREAVAVAALAFTHAEVRLAALSVLCVHGGGGALAALRAVADEPFMDERVRAAARDALARMADRGGALSIDHDSGNLSRAES